MAVALGRRTVPRRADPELRRLGYGRTRWCCASLSVNCAGLRCRVDFYLPITSGAAILLPARNQLRGRTSNRGFAEQRETFGDPSSPVLTRSPAAPRKSKDQAIGCASTPISRGTFAPKTSPPPPAARRGPEEAQRSRKPLITPPVTAKLRERHLAWGRLSQFCRLGRLQFAVNRR